MTDESSPAPETSDAATRVLYVRIPTALHREVRVSAARADTSVVSQATRLLRCGLAWEAARAAATDRALAALRCLEAKLASEVPGGTGFVPIDAAEEIVRRFRRELDLIGEPQE